MWWLVIGLSIALGLTGFWAWQLWRQGSRVNPPPPPPPDLVAPLLETIGATLNDGLIVVHADRRIAFANKALRAIVDIPFEPVEGQSLIGVLRDYHVDALVARTIQGHEPQTMSFQPVLSHRRLQLACHPLGPPLEGAVLVVRDVTRLAQLERARRELVANVSHELRTPLASIRLLVETLLVREMPPEDSRRMLGLIDDETQAVTQLIDELRELNQIESGGVALRVQPDNVAEIVNRAVERMAPQAERRGLEIVTAVEPDPPPVLVDADRIGQVLLNLLHNALKFTPAPGTITVSVRATTPPLAPRLARAIAETGHNDWLVVAVADTGIGIPAVELERVFERLYKVDRARTRDGGGTGLGLAIAKHLIERHGGPIWAESQEGHGSTFSFLLPIA